MKDRIQQLIAEGRVEDALALLAQHSNDALLLQARYNNGKKQYNMGLIEFSEWQRTQTQINYAVLELANSVKSVAIVQQNNITNITINFDNVKDFETSISRLDLPTLVDLVTKELTGKPAMVAWLPLKQEYESYALLGNAYPPGYIAELKQKLVKIYDDYWTNSKSTEAARIKSAVEAIYNSIKSVVPTDEDTIREAITDFQVFFYENPRFAGLKRMKEFESIIDSDKLKLFKTKRPDSYKLEMEKIHSELIQISNRIILNLEK